MDDKQTEMDSMQDGGGTCIYVQCRIMGDIRERNERLEKNKMRMLR